MKTVLTAAAVALSLGTVTLRAELANAIKAVVHDSVITYDEVEVATFRSAAPIAREFSPGSEAFDRKMNELRTETLSKLCDRQLILHDFKSAGFDKLLPESVTDDLLKERTRARFGDRAHLTKSLEEEGMTVEKFRQQLRDNFIIEQMRAKNISSEIIISPHKVESYYLAHRDNFKIEDEVKLRVIVLRAPEDTNAPSPTRLADEILAKIKDGASFTEMAAVYSTGSQRKDGGDMGWYQRPALTKGLADIAFALPVGKWSQVFSRTPGDDYWVYQYENDKPTSARHYGVEASTKKQILLEERKLENPDAMTNCPPPTEFYLMQVEDKHPEHFESLGEVRDKIEKNLLLDEQNRLEKAWMDRLKKKTFVRRF